MLRHSGAMYVMLVSVCMYRTRVVVPVPERLFLYIRIAPQWRLGSTSEPRPGPRSTHNGGISSESPLAGADLDWLSREAVRLGITA